jgi:type IV secretion system protein VirB10
MSTIIENNDEADNEPAALADVIKQSRQQQNNFRGRENDLDEDIDLSHDLPSVNRRKGNNKLVTILGFIFIIAAAAAMIVAVNKDSSKTAAKKVEKEQVSNNLPPLIMPAPPAPIAIRPVVQQTSPQPKPTVVTQNNKPPLDWTDRKMMGTLLVPEQKNSGESKSPHGAYAVAADASDSPLQYIYGPESISSRTGRGKRENEFEAQLEPTVTKAASAAILPDRAYLITKGTSLDCALETALDSTVPGLTTCRLTRDVYSDNGQVLLLDRGTQLVGEYQGGLKQGQVRLFVLWTRAKTPNGVVIALNSPGTDALGRSGLEGWVDNHFWQRFGAAILITLLHDSVAAIANRAVPTDSGGTTNIYSGGSGGERVVEKILESTVNIPPTIVKNQGDHIQIMVARDLDFSDVYGLQVTQ